MKNSMSVKSVRIYKYILLIVIIFLYISSLQAQTQLSWDRNSVNIIRSDGGAGFVDANGCVRITNSATDFTKGSGVWSKTKVDLSKSFSFCFELFFGCNDSLGADGLVFVLQNDSRGLSTLGGLGGNMGFFDVKPSVGIEFDTWQNLDGFPNAADTGMKWDHSDIMVNGNIYPSGRKTPMIAIGKDPLHGMDGNVEDCIQYPFCIDWDVTTHTMTLTQGAMNMNSLSQGPFKILSYSEDFVNTVFGGNSTVYWGFVGSTGGSANEQWVCPEKKLANWNCQANSCCAKFSVKPNTDSVLCTNNLTLGVSGTYVKYNWSTGDTTPTINVTKPGLYKLNVIQDQSGYMCPSSVSINVSTKGPTALLSGTAVICDETAGTSPISVALTGTPPWTLEYSKNGVKLPAVTGINSSPYTFNDGVGVYEPISLKDASICNGVVSGKAIISTYPEIPKGTDVSFCPTAPVTLSVIDNGGTYKWYDLPTNGTLLKTGATFTTPPLSSDKIYYVENEDNTAVVNKSVGYLNTSDPASTKNTNKGEGPGTIYFTANKDFQIISIDFEVKDLTLCTNPLVKLTLFDVTTNKTVKTVNFPNNCVSPSSYHTTTVPCNFSVINGHKYSMSYSASGDQISLYYWNLCPSYPITKDAEITFTSSTPMGSGTMYPGLFNWKIQSGSPAASCARTPIKAIASGISATVKDTILKCYGDKNGVLVATPSSGTKPFTYLWSNDKTTPIITGLQAGTYTVTVSDSTGCSTQVTAHVNSPDSLKADAGNDVFICKGKNTTLIASGSINYSWTTGEKVAQITVAPTITTTYTVIVSDNNKCSASNYVVVSVTDDCKLTPVLSASPNPICLGDTAVVTLKVLSLKPYSLKWSDPLVTLSGDGSFKVSPISNVTYTVTATEDGDAANSNTSSVVIVVNPLPTVTLSGGTLCIGTPITITAGGANTYTWSNGLFGGSSNTVNPGITTTYFVTGTDMNGCTNTATAVVTVNQLPQVVAGGGTICSGESFNLTAGGATNYSWSNNIGNGSTVKVNPVTTATYIVTGTDNQNCTNTSSAVITVNEKPQAEFNYDPDIVLQRITTVNFHDASLFNKSVIRKWSWIPGDNSALMEGANVSHVYNDQGQFTVMLMVENADGCKDTATKNIKVVPSDTITVPNVFTPNNDGVNDYLYIKGIDYGDWQVTIYNRWGRKVYENNKYDNNTNMWAADGCSEGVYYYIAYNKERNITKHGWVEVVK